MNKRIWLLPKMEWADVQALFYKPPPKVSNSLAHLIGHVYELRPSRWV